MSAFDVRIGTFRLTNSPCSPEQAVETVAIIVEKVRLILGQVFELDPDTITSSDGITVFLSQSHNRAHSQIDQINTALARCFTGLDQVFLKEKDTTLTVQQVSDRILTELLSQLASRIVDGSRASGSS